MLTRNQWAVLFNSLTKVNPYENMNTLCALMVRDLIAHDKKMQLRITPLGKAMVKDYNRLQSAPSFANSRASIYPMR